MENGPNFGSLALKDLHCPHCGSLNAEDEPRCRRCGRRLKLPAPPDAPREDAAPPPPPPPPPPRQVPLFDDRPKIIPFESITGTRALKRPGPPARRHERASESRVRPSQPPLDLRAPAARQHRTVNNDAPVAAPRLRVKAAALDGLFIALGVALAAAVVYARGGELVLSGRTLLPYTGAVLSLALFYELFWCLLARETAGMRSMGLRVLTFDGQRPAVGQYLVRFVVTCLSVAAAGIGLIWSLIDDETLTWHDHISKTFPTVLNPQRRG
jgi:uncharacterized RDD family membrane protein YckC